MAMFRYEAVEAKNGQVQRGAMEASSAQEVVARLNARGYQGVEVQTQTAAQTGAATKSVAQPAAETLPLGSVTFLPAVRPQDMAVFFRQMSSLLHSGFNPATAVADLAGRTANRRITGALKAIAPEVANGGSLAASVARHPDVFPRHMVGLLAAGETGGFLEYACEEAALGAEADAALRQGLWVPKLLFWQAVWSILLLRPIMDNLGIMFSAGLGGLTNVAHDFLLRYLPLGILFHVMAELGGLWWRQPFFTGVRDRLSLVLPVMRKLATLRAIAAFTRMLRRLLLAGISPEPAYTAAAKAVPNSVLRERLLRGVPVLRSGNGLDAAIQATGLMEHDPVQMLVTGQKTGQWAEMLDQVTAYYQDRAAQATEDAKGAQKRFAVIITILATAYVTIAVTVEPLKAVMKWLGD